MFLLKLFVLELKRMFCMLPKLFLGALALCAVLAILAFGAGSTLYKEQTINKIYIPVYVPSDDKYVDMMMGIVENIKSVKSLCRFEYVDTKEEIYTAVKNGDAYAGIIFPTNFVQGIVHGQNYSALIVMPKNADTNSALFKELTEGGSGMLGAVQAGIYAFIDQYEQQYGTRISNENVINALNMEYVDFVLPRENYFIHRQWSATGNLSAVEYYAVMALTLFLLLMGMSCIKIVHSDYDTVYRLGKIYGFNGIISFFIKHILVFITYCIIMLLPVAGLVKFMDAKIDYTLFFGIWLASAIVTAVYTLMKNSTAAALTLFAYTGISGFLSGCFLPASFLPDSIRPLSVFMPTYYISQCFGNMFAAMDMDIVIYLFVLIFIYMTVLLIGYIKTGGEDI